MCRGLVSLLFFWLLSQSFVFFAVQKHFHLSTVDHLHACADGKVPSYTHILQGTAYVFYLALSVFQVSNWGLWSIWSGFWCRLMDMGLTSFFYMWIPNFPTLLIEYAVFSLVCIFGIFVKYDMALATFTYACVVFCFVLSSTGRASTILALLLQLSLIFEVW